MKVKQFLLSFALAGALSSCVTRGDNFSTDISWIKKGTSSKADLKRALGEPYQVGYALGSPTWTYGFYKFSLFGESHTKELKVYWAPDGKVSDFSFSSSFPEDVRFGGAKVGS